MMNGLINLGAALALAMSVALILWVVVFGIEAIDQAKQGTRKRGGTLDVAKPHPRRRETRGLNDKAGCQ